MISLQRLIKLVEANRLREALAGVSFLEVPDKVKSYSNYGGELLHLLVRSNVEPGIILKICSEWQQKGINKFGLSQATEAALTFLSYNQAKDYLDQFVKMRDVARPHFYAPLIAKTSSFTRICSLLENDLKPLSSLHPESTFEMFADVIWRKVYPYYDEFFSRCVIIGLTPNFLINTCIAHYLNSGDITRLEQLLSTMGYNFRADYKLVPYLVTYTIKHGLDKGLPLIKRLGSQSLNQVIFNSFFLLNASGVLTDDDQATLESVVRYMRKKYLYITPVAGEILLSSFDGTSLASSIRNLVDRKTKYSDESNAWYTYSSATCSPIEAYETRLKLIERETNPKSRGIIRKLILVYCSMNNQPTNGPNQLVCQRVNQLLDNLNDKNISPAMASTLMAFFAINDDLEKALFYKNLIPDGFTTDLSKILHLAIKMVSSGLLNDSVDMILLEIYKSTIKPTRPDFASYTTNSLVRDYLELIGEETKDIKLVKDLCNSFLSNQKIKPNNKSLRPRVTIHLTCNDVRGALDEFYHCLHTFRLTPGQNILLDYLIDKKMFNQLESLLDSVCKYFDKTDIVFNCVHRLVVKGYPESGQNLITKMKLYEDKQSIRTLIVHNIAKQNIQESLSLVQFYGSKFDLEEKAHFYNRIYSLSSESKDLNSVDKIINLMKREKIEPFMNDNISTKEKENN
ncbi:uncharacterized protein LOC107372056 [Tetranychus urticae]|uniref:uncharacterized protein LOC107372056 n=1 Tax=Tetranychus urticae TaxID=32264 RepID=UPI00077BF83B|nr:uncharacterized protein LOC107372056 [Tetranychus urticae]